MARTTARAAAVPVTSGRWSQDRRLQFIDFRLRWDGRLNRGDLTDFFGISVPQASLDIARYTDLAPRNLAYDRSARVYLAGQHFKALFPSSSASPFLDALLATASGAVASEGTLLGYVPPAAVVPTPGRTLNLEVLVALQRAMRERTGIRVLYQSLTRPEPMARTLSPHAFAHDGYRWHVRAYCHEREAFRDFVIARILEVQGTAPTGKTETVDVAWNTMVKLVLTAHPKLPAAHRRAVELDYGMEHGQVTLECRQAFLFYVLRHLRLESDAATPQAQQVVLKNKGEVERHRRESGAA